MYTFGSLLPGAYRIRVEAKRLQGCHLDSWLRSDASTTGDLNLEVGSPAETVNVEAHAVAVSPTQTGLEGIVTESLFRDCR